MDPGGPGADEAASRAAARGVYLRLSPLAPAPRPDDPHFERHRLHARALGLAAVALAPLILGWASAVDHLAGVTWPTSGAALQAVWLVAGVLSGAAPLLLLLGASLRAAGRGDPPPLFRWTGLDDRRVRRAWAALGAAALAALLGLAALERRAARLTRRVAGVVPRCWLLHADNLDAPAVERAVHRLGFARIAAAACERWGEGAAAIEPLTRASLREALAAGRLVFVASHGGGGQLPLDGEAVGPDDLRDVLRPGPGLRLVYFGACEAGQARWDQALAPAEVVAWPRLTSIFEHAWWQWVTAPARVRAFD